jgi:hypothetical protein
MADSSDSSESAVRRASTSGSGRGAAEGARSVQIQLTRDGSHGKARDTLLAMAEHRFIRARTAFGATAKHEPRLASRASQKTIARPSKAGTEAKAIAPRLVQNPKGRFFYHQLPSAPPHTAAPSAATAG